MVAQPANPVPIALRVARAFEALGIPYLIGGSVASTMHGEPRGTLDVDFAVHMDPSIADALVMEMESDFFVDVSAVREAAAAKRMFNMIHNRNFLKVDVHVRAATGHSAEEMSRARLLPLSDEGAARIATPEDTLLRKLWWYRIGDHVSDRQWRDAKGIVTALEGKLDQDYLMRWADNLEVADLLERVLSDGST